MGLRTYIRARACVRVQSIYLVGGGLTIEVNIPLQELEGQRGEGAYIFGRIRYYDSVPKCHALAAVIAGDIYPQSSDHDEIEAKEHNSDTIDVFTSLTTYEILTAPTTYIAGSCISPILH